MAKPVGVRRMAMFWLCALLVERLERLLLAGAELLVDGAPAHLVVLALEQRRQHAAQLVDGRDHALGQRRGAAVRQLQRLGPVGVVEVVDIDPVGGAGASAAFGPRCALTAVLLPEAGGPSTKMLKSWLLMLAPNWMAFSARSWPIRPVIGCSSSVVLKPSVAGSTTRRSSEASSGCGLAATVVTSPLRAGDGTSYWLRALEKHAISHPGCCVRPATICALHVLKKRPPAAAASTLVIAPARAGRSTAMLRTALEACRTHGDPATRYPAATAGRAAVAGRIRHLPRRRPAAQGAWAGGGQRGGAGQRAARRRGRPVGDSGEIWIVEIKSCLEDFRADQKWPEYREFCDRLFFAVAPDFPREVLPADTGLIIADRYGGEIVRAGARAQARRRAAQGHDAAAWRALAALRLQGVIDPEGGFEGLPRE